MTQPERAKLIPVSGASDQPDLAHAINVQFNPATLRVALSNTLKENPRQGNSRATQFVDKSSSSLSVELLFDTTFIDEANGDGTGATSGSDVRLLTKKIAELFIKPVESGSQLGAPSRCLFQWGAFEFLGMIQGFDETLDYFSPEGCPLRASLSLRLVEDRYQFRSREAQRVERETPVLSSTGSGDPQSGAPPSQQTSPVPGPDGGDPRDWRATALFNGLESPRLPSLATIARPTLSLGVSASAGASAGVPFRFGASANVGTSIAGAFSASATLTPSSRSRVPATARVEAPTVSLKVGVGFD